MKPLYAILLLAGIGIVGCDRNPNLCHKIEFSDSGGDWTYWKWNVTRTNHAPCGVIEGHRAGKPWVADVFKAPHSLQTVFATQPQAQAWIETYCPTKDAREK